MDTPYPLNIQQNSTYPYLINYSQGIPPVGVNQNYIPSNMIPLIEQCRDVVEPDKVEERLQMPSYKEVKEELSEKLENKSRKEKRKMIKNKRNRMKRKMIQNEETTLNIV